MSRVTRVSPVPSRLTTTISQSSRVIIWNATRLPPGDSGGEVERSGPFRTIVGAAAGSAVATVMRLVSSAVRLTKTIVPPSAEKDGELPVIVAIFAVRNRQHAERGRCRGSARSRPPRPAAPAPPPPLPPRPAPGARVVKRSAVPVELMPPMILSFCVRRHRRDGTGGADEMDLARAGAAGGRRKDARCRRRRRRAMRRVSVPGVERASRGPWRARGARLVAPGRSAGRRRPRFQYADLRAVGRERRATAAELDDDACAGRRRRRRG